MFRTPPTRVLRRLAPTLVLAGAMALPLHAGLARAAAGPSLTIKCFSTKAHDRSTCWTWGNSFAAGESVRLTYNVTFLTMPKVNGRHPMKSFTRTVKINGYGSFVHAPSVTFATAKAHTTFSILVKALGAQKDTGTTSLAEIGT